MSAKQKKLNLPPVLRVSEWMERCNRYYYATRDPLGVAGDFTTAPEISQIFGELIGAWLAVMRASLAAEEVQLVELGPGRGTLMQDMLRAGGKALQAGGIHLVETSPALRRKQAERLKGYSVFWHESLETLPEKPSLFVANEFFDALPVAQYVGEEERRVEWREGRHVFAPEGEVTRESSPASLAVMRTLCGVIARQGGAALIVDYGYDAPGVQDSLQAVRRHRRVSPLEDPGEADLTAHVDFGALAQAAREAGLSAHGPVAQGDFLRRLGAEWRAIALCEKADAAGREAILAGLHRLIAPEAMGALFKLLAITRPAETPPGF